jgi:hypothetical protein
LQSVVGDHLYFGEGNLRKEGRLHLVVREDTRGKYDEKYNGNRIFMGDKKALHGFE